MDSRLPTGDEFLTLRDVGVTFADTGEEVLAGVSFTVPAGGFVAVVGRSGVGKSTLLRVIGGLLRPTTGVVRLNGADPADSDEAIGIVFQRDNLMPWRTVAQNVGLPLELNGDGEKGRKRDGRDSDAVAVGEALAMVGLAGQGDNYPAQLSGGMAQRVALARALVMEPALLLADEPTGNLDTRSGEQVLELLRRLNVEQGITCVIVTHDDRIADRCDRNIHLVDGLVDFDRRRDPAAPAGA